MTDQEFEDNIFNATTYMRVAAGPEYFFWEGYLRGLRLYYNPDEFEADRWFDFYKYRDDLETQGFDLGLAGNSVEEAMAIGKQGKHKSGINRNYQKDLKDGDLEKIGVFYHGKGNWTLPKGAKITLGEPEPGLYLGVRDGTNWVIKLGDGSQLVVWSEDIPGIYGPPWDND